MDCCNHSCAGSVSDGPGPGIAACLGCIAAASPATTTLNSMGVGTQFASGGVLHYPPASLLPPSDYQNVVAPLSPSPQPLYQNSAAVIGSVLPAGSRVPSLLHERVGPPALPPPPSLPPPPARPSQHNTSLAPASVEPRLSVRTDINTDNNSKMVAKVDMFATAALPLHHHHPHHHHQQQKLPVGNHDAHHTDLLLQQHHRKLQVQHQEISDQILLMQTQVLQQQLEQLQQARQQLKRQLEQQQQPTSSLLLNPLPALLPPQPPTPALLITASQPSFAASPQLDVARVNLFGGVSHSAARLTSAAAADTPDIGAILSRTRAQLADCGWYHGCLSWQESNLLLENTAPGTFLVRDSQNPSCIYSLSVQRGPQLGGPTSIRIQFHAGRFALDAESEETRRLMPAFDSVGELVEFYTRLSCSKEQQQLLLDSCHPQSPIVLLRPLYRDPPSLAQLCRLAVNRSLAACGRPAPLEQLNLPAKLAAYLEAYTLSI